MPPAKELPGGMIMPGDTPPGHELGREQVEQWLGVEPAGELVCESRQQVRIRDAAQAGLDSLGWCWMRIMLPLLCVAVAAGLLQMLPVFGGLIAVFFVLAAALPVVAIVGGGRSCSRQAVHSVIRASAEGLAVSEGARRFFASWGELVTIGKRPAAAGVDEHWLVISVPGKFRMRCAAQHAERLAEAIDNVLRARDEGVCAWDARAVPEGALTLMHPDDVARTVTERGLSRADEPTDPPL